MHNAVAALPPYDPSAVEQLARPVSEPGKRQWETSKAGYFVWAVEQLLERAKERGQGEGSSAVTAVANAASATGSTDDVKRLVEVLSSEKAEEAMDVD